MPSDPTRPGGPRYSPAQRRLLTTAAGLIVAALAGGAFALTYDMLRKLAVTGGIGDRWAPLYPAMADTLTAMTILSLVVTRNARWWTRALRWALLLLLVAGGAALSVQHSVWGFASMPGDAVRAGVAIGPHVMLVLAVWLWLTMFKQIRVARPAAKEAAPADMQRGHVKVLEPAAPEQPALMAPAGETSAEEAPAATKPASESPLAFLDVPEPEQEPLIPFQEPSPQPDEPTHHAEERTADAEETLRRPHSEPQAPAEFEPAADNPAAPQPADGEKYGAGRSLSSEPAPPLDALPEPRPVPEPAPEPASEPVPAPEPAPPALLPTDVELVRSRDRDDAEDKRPVASTTRPDIVMPALLGADEEEHDTPPSDRAEDPDAGDHPHDRSPGGDARDGRQGDGTADDWNPPPSSSFRSGPVPPID